jgi:hypothetical protein
MRNYNMIEVSYIRNFFIQDGLRNKIFVSSSGILFYFLLETINYGYGRESYFISNNNNKVI